MANQSFIAVPSDVTDPIALKRFLEVVNKQIDIAFGNRGTDPFVLSSVLEELNLTNNPKQEAISDLNQTISATYSQSEVQAISDKLDETLLSLRNSNIIKL